MPETVSKPFTQDASLSATGVHMQIGDKTLLHDVNGTFRAGEVVGLIGHNGSGKSTFLKILARQLEATSGKVLLNDQAVEGFSSRAFARELAYLPQDTAGSGVMKAEELVACGRYPWHGALGRITEKDRTAVRQAMQKTGVEDLQGRWVSTLSGGERQRVLLAMLLAQESRFMLLDEPTSALDIAHQVEVLRIIHEQAHAQKIGVVIVLHDINMAMRFCDRLIALKAGQVVAEGAPSDLVAPDTLEAIYGIRMDVLSHPSLNIPVACAC